MFEAYLQSIEGINPKYKHFAVDAIDYIKSSIEKEKPLYAVHGFCTDGGVCGSMIRYAIPEAAIVPLDYWMINNKHANEDLANIKWSGIVDLSPFNNKPLDFWVDHHISAMDSRINANRIRYDIDGDSGAYQLLLSEFLGPLPETLVELAVMTRTTDTANYVTEPPIEKIGSIDDLQMSKSKKNQNREEREKRIWLLDDAWGSVETFKQHLNLYNYLAKDGFYGLRHSIDRINKIRNDREEARIIADEIELNTDVIMFTFDQDTVDKFTIIRRLQTRGAKVVVSLSITNSNRVKISFRRNRFLDEEDNKRIQLNEIAEKLNGGGHPGAAGAMAENLDKAKSTIDKWAKEINLSTKLVEL